MTRLCKDTGKYRGYETNKVINGNKIQVNTIREGNENVGEGAYQRMVLL